MNKLNLLMLVVLLGSSLLLVKTSHEARQLFTQVDRAEREQKLLDAEYRRLDTERQTQATNQKVERVARQRLHMSAPPLTVYIDNPLPAAAMPGTPGMAATRTAQALR